jgi:O-antigen/teichoic acid export membrane protein
MVDPQTKTSRRYATLATLVGTSSTTVIVAVQTVALVPLYLHAIGAHLYGAWLGSGDFLVWMQTFDLGLPNVIIQRVGAAHGKGDSKSVGEYFATGMLTMAIIAILLGLAAFAVSYKLPGWMQVTGEEARTLQLCFMVGSSASALTIFNNSVVGFARGIQKTALVNAFTIIASLVSFAVSLILVLKGWGLWAIALGLMARAVVLLLASAIFVVTTARAGLVGVLRIRKRILREFLLVSPATALGGIGYAVMNQSDTALVAIFLSPELAAVLNLSRKALEVGRGLVDTIAFATYGGFAHLSTSDQRQRTLEVHAEITTLRLSLALAMAAAFMAVNSSLVTVWVGPSQYGGSMLTILIALQFIFVGNSFLMNYLYRALGPVMKGSLALAAESLTRVPLMIGLLLWLGLPGIPIAGIVTGSIYGLLSYRWTIREVASFASPRPRPTLAVWATRVALFGVGALFCIFFQWNNWFVIIALGSAVTLVGIGALAYVDPWLKVVRDSLAALLGRLQIADPITRT